MGEMKIISDFKSNITTGTIKIMTDLLSIYIVYHDCLRACVMEWPDYSSWKISL